MASGTLSCEYGTIPVMTRQTMTYTNVQITSEPIIPIGRLRCGFLTSSAEAEIASNPRNAKRRQKPRNDAFDSKRHKRMPIARLYKKASCDDKQQNNSDFYENHYIIKGFALFRAS